MEKRKIMGIGLSALLILGMAGSFLGAPARKYVYADETGTQSPLPDEGTNEPALPEDPKEDGPVTLTTENAELFLPGSYEQYLPLVNPAYMAMSENYIAVADDTLLYVYDKRGGEYECYPLADETRNSPVTKIQISDDERLFFSTKDGWLYEFSFTDKNVEPFPEVHCTTFLMAGNYLYSVYYSTDAANNYLSRYPLDNLTLEGQESIRDTTAGTPSKLSYADGRLYCVRQDTDIYAYDEDNIFEQIFVGKLVGKSGAQVADLKFVCVFDGYLYYSVNGTNNPENGLWRTDFNGNSEQMLKGDGYSAITTFRSKLYCLRNQSILQLTVTEDGVEYSGYEIAASSSSQNRLVNAVDSVRAGDLLVTADKGARRVSVYNYTTESYSVIDCEFAPSLVATDGETIAAASGTSVYTCKYGDAEFELKATLGTDIRGLACVYGSVYYISSKRYGKVDGNENDIPDEYGTPLRMTRDLYGNIFVSFDNGKVYSFTEDTFLSRAGSGKLLGFSLPSSHTSLRSDFEGNIYCLSGNTVYKNGEAFANIDGNAFVYLTEAETDTPVSFALGFEDSEVYFFFGNYVVKSEEDVLVIPTLNKIDTEDIADEVFAVQEKEGLFVDIPEKTVAVKITLSELDGAQYFPYESYYRLTENRRGVLLGATERYYLVLLPEGRSFTANLFRINEDYLVDESEYWTEPAEGENTKFYLSSRVSSYFAPCLESALAEILLARGTSVEVLGYVTAPDLDYALVSFAAEDGAHSRSAATGYVPKSFLTTVSPLPPENSEYISVYLKENEEGVVFTSADGTDSLLIKERTQVKAVKNDDGTYTVFLEKDGTTYSATVDEGSLDKQDSGALRIALIIILSVLALVIIGAYIFLLPRKTQKNEKIEKTDKKSSKKE